jgi:K+-sensing histidine kinase KdpD
MMRFEYIEFAYGDLLRDVKMLLAPKASEKGIGISLLLPSQASGIVYADPQRFRQIFTNLLGNALKFTEKGSIEIKVEEEPSSGSSPSMVRISVLDTGIGVPEEKADKLFLQFSQVDSSHTRKYGGTGLGLAISKRLTEAMGGKIGYLNRPEGGSIFWFSLPCSAGVKTTLSSYPTSIYFSFALFVVLRIFSVPFFLFLQPLSLPLPLSAFARILSVLCVFSLRLKVKSSLQDHDRNKL